MDILLSTTSSLREFSIPVAFVFSPVLCHHLSHQREVCLLGLLAVHSSLFLNWGMSNFAQYLKLRFFASDPDSASDIFPFREENSWEDYRKECLNSILVDL